MSRDYSFQEVRKLAAMHPGERGGPVLKWPGGKAWLAPRLRELLRREFGKSGRYFEPFLGGGAAFFQLLPKVSLLSDINAELIEFYEVMRDDPDGLMRSVWRNSNDRENYYRVRSSSPRTALGRAARFLYLNRTCWGGVYRVNKQGKFNVPFGNSGRHICRKAAVLQAAAALRHSDLRIRDFELALDESTAGDVVYLDPPYSQGFGKDCFGRYNSVRFEWEDHLRLVKASKRAARRGAFVVISAAMHKDLLETLPRWTVLSFDRNSLVGRSRASRLPVTEALLFSRVPAFTALGDE